MSVKTIKRARTTKHVKLKKTNAGKQLECEWPLDEEHEGEVRTVVIFEGQLKITMCDRHLEWHIAIMSLHKAGWDTEEVLSMEREKCIAAARKHGLLKIVM